ncbi:MAG: hypothetical protein EOP83_37200, partial [Verrucomicrobiaceae bacterium]
FLVIGSLYLVIVAYGVVGTRKRGLPIPMRITGAAVQVVLPPVILLGVMSLEPKLFPLASWTPVIGMLMLAGALLAICTDIVARRVL